MALSNDRKSGDTELSDQKLFDTKFPFIGKPLTDRKRFGNFRTDNLIVEVDKVQNKEH